MFTISWRNPSSEHAGWNLDTYLEAVVESLDAVEAITGSDRTQVLGLCAGGTLSAIVAARLAERATATGSPVWRWASTCSTPRSRATPPR